MGLLGLQMFNLPKALLDQGKENRWLPSPQPLSTDDWLLRVRAPLHPSSRFPQLMHQGNYLHALIRIGVLHEGINRRLGWRKEIFSRSMSPRTTSPMPKPSAGMSTLTSGNQFNQMVVTPTSCNSSMRSLTIESLEDHSRVVGQAAYDPIVHTTKSFNPRA